MKRSAVVRRSLDPARSRVTLEVQQLGLLRHRAQFTRFHGDVTLSGADEPLRADLDIDATSLTSGFGRAADALAADHLLRAARFPGIRIRARSVRFDGRRGRASADLTLAGVTRPVELDVVATPAARDGALSVQVKARVDRREWGVGDLPGVRLSPIVAVNAELTLLRPGA